MSEEKYTIKEYVQDFVDHLTGDMVKDVCQIIGEHSPSGLWPHIEGMTERFPDPGWGWVDTGLDDPSEEKYNKAVAELCISEIDTNCDPHQFVLNVWDWCQKNDYSHGRIRDMANKLIDREIIWLD